MKRVIADVFSAVSKRYDTFLHWVTGGRIHAWQKDLLSMLTSEGNRLDVGTGTGEVLLKSQNTGLRVGMDISRGMLSVAKGKCRDCYFVLGDAENMPFKDSSFSSVVLSLVYRHLQDRDSFLAEAYRILKEGGEMGILDINRFLFTPMLVFIMKYPLKPLGALLFGGERWDFFIHSLENSLSWQDVLKEAKGRGFRLKKVELRFAKLVYLLVLVKE
ncbi:Methyltransferase type 11 [Thermocrinis albus DSM 14484]|uniref:Methyltransferase type 11 n=1 Tax=Thermocrinis albus (strain DSM 14484 / JCM 11386 / HI 11/12) TaxID=638303 RepID=D3SN26_THEAH|nr:methyltransferase domain-containing protein [Thermocrinis albus]ADC90156.1 Methyltransferase type 11 [Thermocrinis albus DSM 14484]